VFGFIAAAFFFLAVIVHGGPIAVHTAWLNTTGLTLLGFLALALHLTIPYWPPWRRG